MNPGLSITPAPLHPEHGPLQQALEREAHVVRDVLAALQAQRAGVQRDDIAAVRDSVYAAQRTLLTLAQARRQRRSLLELLTGDPDTPLRVLESALADDIAPELACARDELVGAARALAHEVAANQELLRGALALGRSTGGPTLLVPPEGDPRSAGLLRESG